MGLPKFLQPYLASYDLSKLDIVEDKKLIITEVLNKGDDKALRWLCKTYTLRDFKEVVSNPIRGMWYKEILRYWLRILDIKISKYTYDLAIIELNNFRPKLYERFFREQERKHKRYHKRLVALGLNTF